MQFSEYGPQANSISINWNPVRNAVLDPVCLDLQSKTVAGARQYVF